MCVCTLTIGLFNECTVRVDASSPLGLQFSQSQNIFQAIKSHLNYFGVHESEQVTQRFNAAEFHQVPAGGSTHTDHKRGRTFITHSKQIIVFVLTVDTKHYQDTTPALKDKTTSHHYITLLTATKRSPYCVE